MIVFLGRTVAPFSPGPPSATLQEETRYWKMPMSGKQNSQSAAGGEGVNQSFPVWGKGKPERDKSFNETHWACGVKIQINQSINNQ